MSIEIKVPVLPESVEDAAVALWHKKTGEAVARGDILVELETDKVMLEVPAPDAGVLGEVLAATGAVVNAEQVLAILNTDEVCHTSAVDDAKSKVAPIEAAAKRGAGTSDSEENAASDDQLSPSVRRLLQQHELDAALIQGTGRAGRITKQDVLQYIKLQPSIDVKQVAASSAAGDHSAVTTSAAAQEQLSFGLREEKRVPMTRLRARIAERLLQSQKNAAMLSTFNEVNMQAVMDLRKKYKEQFEKTHNIKLGLSSFFVKAACLALQQFPVMNAAIDGNDIVYHNYVDIGVAVGGGPRGLVVPVLRQVEDMTLAEIEQAIRAYAEKARAGKISLEDMQGGTFTITNGGVYGSMLSTPIINPPQSAILGMHSIKQRAMVEADGTIVARPMMYLALSYDHCLIDGEQAVRFLVAIKDALEDPARMLLGL